MISSSTGSSSPWFEAAFLVARWSHVHVWQRVRRSVNVAEAFTCPHSRSLSSLLCRRNPSRSPSLLSSILITQSTFFTQWIFALSRRYILGLLVYSLAFEICCGRVLQFFFLLALQNIKKKMYGCTEAFLADAKWILHNCIIYNGGMYYEARESGQQVN